MPAQRAVAKKWAFGNCVLGGDALRKSMDLRSQRLFRLALGAGILAGVVWGLVLIIGILSRGPDSERFRVAVIFKDVQGLGVGSRCVHRGKTIGEVAALEIEPSARRVRALLSLEHGAKDLVTTVSQFWIVRPRFGGLQNELTGLDTLIKESYVRLRVPTGGEKLRGNEELLGLERPPEDLAYEDLDDPRTGDLLATVVLPDGHGLRAGSAVRYRGQDVGECRRVYLSQDGRGILVRFRVLRAFRNFCTASSRVWVARPILQGSLLTGMTIDSLSSLLGSALVFDTPMKDGGNPLADDAVVVGLASPPRGSIDGWDGERVRAATEDAQPDRRDARPRSLSPWVTVRYRAIEEDSLSGDDQLSYEGEGVLFRNARNELMVVTRRSSCDGSFLIEGTWYDSVRIRKERTRIQLEDGRVWPASRVWTDPQNRDLALLRVQTPANSTPSPLPELASYLDFERTELGDETVGALGKVLKQGGRAFGIVGCARFDESSTQAIYFSAIPAGERAASKR